MGCVRDVCGLKRMERKTEGEQIWELQNKEAIISEKMFKVLKGKRILRIL